jgi:hypothetical protein
MKCICIDLDPEVSDPEWVANLNANQPQKRLAKRK